MRKVTAVLLAAGILLAISTSVMAEVQNVRLGGDIRTRMYYTKNLYSVDVPEKEDDFFFRQRTRISAEADLTDNVWVVATVEADGVWGQQVVVQQTEEVEVDGTPVDVTVNRKVKNEWDVNIAEAYIQLSEIAYSPWTTKIGRQYLNYGRGFLISSREWEYKFDAWRNILDFYPWTIDLFYSRLVESDQAVTGGGLDKAADDEDLWGLNMNYQADLWSMEGYVFGKRDAFDADSEDSKQAPIAVGVRFDASPVEAFDIWGEFAYEFGKYQTDAMRIADIDEESIRAFGFDLGMVYVFDVTWEPAIALSYTYGSGDKADDAANPDKKTFDPLFNYNYYGYAYSPRLSNIGILNLQASILPSESTTFVLDFYYYSQAKDRAMVMGNPDMDNGGVDSITSGEDKNLGMELDAIFEYDYTEDVSTQFVGAWFKPGKAYDLPTNDEDPRDVFEFRAEILVSF